MSRRLQLSWRARILSAAAGGAVVLAGSACGPRNDDFARLRMCESGDNYAYNDGTYFGAYNFTLATWRGLGFSGRPDQASPTTQDLAAQELHDQAGWGPWPGCTAKLGLR